MDFWQFYYYYWWIYFFFLRFLFLIFRLAMRIVCQIRSRTIQLQAAHCLLSRSFFSVTQANTHTHRTQPYSFVSASDYIMNLLARIFGWKIAESECCKHLTWSYFILIWRKVANKKDDTAKHPENEDGKKKLWYRYFAPHAHTLTRTHRRTHCAVS